MSNKQFAEPVLKVGSAAIAAFSFPKSASITFNGDVQNQGRDFLAVLNGRSSGRQFSPVQINELGALFYHGSRSKSSFRDPFGARFEKRNYASPGALHSIHSLVTELAGDSWYAYNASRHCFDVMAIDSAVIASFKTTCSQLLQSTKNAWLIWYVCDYDRLCSRYSQVDSLIFRESGHLSATHSLVAEYLDLAYCPLGYHGHEAAAQLSDERQFVGVGSALVGKPAC